MSLSTPESVQKLQTALHDKAKGSPNFRFYALYDKVYRKDVLVIASLLGTTSRETAMLRKYKSYASSLLGRVAASPEADDPPSAGTSPCRTLVVICSRMAILSDAATATVSRQTLRLFATSTASSV